MVNPAQPRFSRIFGDDAVLALLERLGKTPRTFPNLVSAGMPAGQLEEARDWYIQDATTPVERYAGERMSEGYFEDESLLALLCRFFECTDWKLEGSPWFYSREDYLRCFRAVMAPLQFHMTQLEQGNGEEHWGGNFLKLPFDLGMERAMRSMWEEVGQGEYFWSPQATYGHLRAANIFSYLHRTVDVLRFSPHHFNYNWEGHFRRIFDPVLRCFRESMEQAVRRWGEIRRERTENRFHYGQYEQVAPGGAMETVVRQALVYFGLEPGTATIKELQTSFRKLSKQTHPDHGGTPEDFRRVAELRDVVENWLRRAQPS